MTAKNHRHALLISLFFVLLLAAAKKIVLFAAPATPEKQCATMLTPTTNDRAALPATERSVIINDASCLNGTAVAGVVRITNDNDVAEALQYAREQNLTVTSAGARHSMGGQAFLRDGLVLDMRGMNRMILDREQSVLTVQSGATWKDAQHFLDAEGLAVKAMQSINIFTVGGTLSVNAHGIAHRPGPIASTVRSMRIMTSDGLVHRASPTENAELFSHALGGYGLFGVILDADLDVVPNAMYAWHTDRISYRDFPEYYRAHIQNNDTLGLSYARISVSPTSYLRDVLVHTFARVPDAGTPPPLVEDQATAVSRFVFNLSKTGSVGRWIRWQLEQHLAPRLAPCVSRNTVMAALDTCIMTRNQGMYDAMGYLSNRLPDTDLLQEYFIPHDRMAEFVDGLRATVKKNKANLLNVTIRFVERDTVTALPYAKDDMFAFVLYVNEKLNDRDRAAVEHTTRELIDLSVRLGGTFYLPYQLVYSPDQLRAAYPAFDAFVATKKRLDPLGLFSNTWFAKYATTSRTE